MKIKITAKHTGKFGREGNVISKVGAMLKVDVKGVIVTLGAGEYEVIKEGMTIEESKNADIKKVAIRNKEIEAQKENANKKDEEERIFFPITYK